MIVKILKYLLVIIFIFSALTKIIDFTNTAYLFMGLTGWSFNNIKISMVILIITELFIAYVIYSDIINNKNVFIIVLTMILLFTIYGIVLLNRGYDNCGCFGTLLKIGPVESIGKNIFLIILLIFLRSKLFRKKYE